MTASTRPIRRPPNQLFELLSSFGLSIGILFLLLVVTLKGTLEQERLGLYLSQRTYFETFFFRWHLGGRFAIWFPGGYLLLSLLFVNLLCGGLIRIRKKTATLGVIIGHLGVLGLLVAGFVEYHFADRGHIKFYENESHREFVSFHDWELVVAERKGQQLIEQTIPGEQFEFVGNASPGTRSKLANFESAGWPFRLCVHRFMPNCRPSAARPGEGIDGVVLRELDRHKEAPNEAGLEVELRSSTDSMRGLLLGSTFAQPWVVTFAGRTFAIHLRHKVFDLPFSVRLDKFKKEDHPGTGKPKWFSSDVSWQQLEGDGLEQRAVISMNEPLRHGGYVLYQTNWGPQDRGFNGPLYSVLEVASNPTDQWPKWLCWLIALGMSTHFVGMLLRYIRRQTRRREESPAEVS